MAVKILTTSGTPSSGTWYGIEAINLGAVVTNTNYDDLNTNRTIAFTPANAGHLMGLWLPIKVVNTTSGTLTIQLQQNTGTWGNVGTPTTVTNNATNFSCSNTWTYIPLSTYTSQTVTAAASTWRFIVSIDVSSRLNLWRSGTAGDYSYAVALDYSTANPSSTDTIFVADGCTLTMDGNFTFGATSNRALIQCQNSILSTANPPTAAYTLTFNGRCFMGSSGGHRFGATGAGKIAAAKKVTIDYSGAGSFIEAPTDYLGSAVNDFKFFEYYGAEDSYLAVKIASDAAASQKNIVLASDMSATWATSDTINIVGKTKTAPENTTYTIASFSGTTLTTNANLDAIACQGGYVVNLNRNTQCGITIKGANNTYFLTNQCYYDYMKMTGTYLNAGYLAKDASYGFTKMTNSTTVDEFSNVLANAANDNNVFTFTIPSSVSASYPTAITNFFIYNTITCYGRKFSLSCNNASINGFTCKNMQNTNIVLVSGNSINIDNFVTANTYTAFYHHYFSGSGWTIDDSGNFGGDRGAAFALNSCTITNYRAQGGATNDLTFNATSNNNRFNSCYFGNTTAAGTAEIGFADGIFVQNKFYNCTFATTPVGSMATLIAGSETSIYDDSGTQKTYKPEGYYTISTATPYAGKKKMLFYPSSSSSALAQTMIIPVNANQSVTVTARAKKNSAYGTTNLPYIKISGMGMTPDTDTMTNVDDTYQDLTVTGTPTMSGGATFEIGGQSAGASAECSFDAISYPPFEVDTGSGFFWYEGRPFPVIFASALTARDKWNDDPYVTADNETTALAYTGISLNTGTTTITLTSNHSVSELYQYIKAKCRDSEIPNAYFTTSDGTNWNCLCTLILSGAALSGTGSINLNGKTVTIPSSGSTTLRLTGGTLSLTSAATINLSMGTMTVDYLASGTYDHRAASITGTITVDTTNDSTVTAQFAPGTTITNADAGHITVESSTSVTVTVASIVSGAQVRVTKSSDGTELLNTTATGTSASFNYTYTTDFDVLVRVRKGSAATKYLEWNGSGTVTTAGLTVTANLLEDTFANATTHASIAGDWTISGAAKTITHSSGTTVYTTNELYTYLQDWADASTNMQYVNPIVCNVAGQSYTLGSGWTLATDSEQYLKTGGIATSDAGVIYTNVFTVGSIVASSNVYIKQNGAKITPWWSTGHVDVLIKVKTGGSLIDSGNLYFYVRKYGTLYEYSALDASAGGRQVAAISTLSDPDNQTSSVTVAGYNDITITWGTASKDIGDGLGATNYDVVIDGAGRTIAQIYEYLKYVLVDGTTATQNSVQGQLYLSANPATYTIIKTAPFGTLAGGVFFGARGVWLENMATADALNYSLIDAAGTTHNPPAPPTTISVTSITNGSRIQLYNVTTDEELANEIVSGTSYTYTYTPGAGDEAIRVRLTYVAADSAKLFYEANITANTSGGSLVASQVDDEVYATNAIDGSGVTACSVSGTTIKIYVDDDADDNAINMQDIYNWYCYMLFTESGIRDQGWYLRAVDSTSYKAYSSLLINNQGDSPLLLGGGYILPSAGGTALDCYDTTGNPIFMGYNHAVGLPYSTGGTTGATDALTLPDFLALK